MTCESGDRGALAFQDQESRGSGLLGRERCEGAEV